MQPYAMSASYDDTVYDGDFYYDQVYCGGGYFNHENYIRGYCTEEDHEWEYCYHPACDQETYETYHQEYCDEEEYDQEDYIQEEYVQEHSDEEDCDLDHECTQDLIDEENILDKPCESTKESKPPREPQTHVYAVIYELHGLYSESEHNVQGMYSSPEKANAAARRCFRKNCPDYVPDLRKVKSFSVMGSGAEWMKNADGEIELGHSVRGVMDGKLLSA